MADDGNGSPRIARVLETALYVDDLVRASHFYDHLFGFSKLFADARLIAYDVGGESVLLLFARGASVTTQTLPGGEIPAHDGSGALHMAFAIDRDELAPWEDRLGAGGIAIEGRVEWPRGGVSLYFRDPDRNLLELATPGLWKSY
ncbi:VOC family protein [Methylopila sp. Yamaguchi]|uniref:VOC family protein n=1 Tax=Methylopila sp. Yamaguchi TaxID=1437817 RepID=UPI000CBB468B|nr:VOC family protein [Methylopila sp. Yamaguchi]GBD49326.1 lactoylglutathione lyase [Methylopila sp. Yamaguchi]